MATLLSSISIPLKLIYNCVTPFIYGLFAIRQIFFDNNSLNLCCIHALIIFNYNFKADYSEQNYGTNIVQKRTQLNTPLLENIHNTQNYNVAQQYTLYGHVDKISKTKTNPNFVFFFL